MEYDPAQREKQAPHERSLCVDLSSAGVCWLGGLGVSLYLFSFKWAAFSLMAHEDD